MKNAITEVSSGEWTEAQAYESNTWVLNNQRNSYAKLIYKFIKLLRHPRALWQNIVFRDFYCGDDWNFWWMEKFEKYKALPKHITNALEVGCGPYSNIRIVSKLVQIDNITCTDPLMDTYKKFKLTWVSEMARKGKIKAITETCESISATDNFYDLVICNNVLDHVQDAPKCFREMHRVLKPGGHFVFSQDLTSEAEIARQPKREGHPIRLNHTILNETLDPLYTPALKKILPESESRSDEFYGTYIFIGVKK